MARYIDIEYLFKKLCCFADGTRIPDVGCDNFPIQINIKDIRHELAKAPTADVKEVVRGEWMGDICNGKKYVTCNKCLETYRLFVDGKEQVLYFCPNCGADMRKGDTNDR